MVKDQPLLNLLALAGVDPDTLRLYANDEAFPGDYPPGVFALAEGKEDDNDPFILLNLDGTWFVSTSTIGDAEGVTFEEAVAFLREWVNA